MAACLGVSEFATYFRRTISEVRGKSKIRRPDPCFVLPRPAVLLPKIRLCSEVSDFSPHFRKTRPCIMFSCNKKRIPRQHPVVTETSKGRCRKTEQRPFFVIASRRVHGDCITGGDFTTMPGNPRPRLAIQIWPYYVEYLAHLGCRILRRRFNVA